MNFFLPDGQPNRRVKQTKKELNKLNRKANKQRSRKQGSKKKRKTYNNYKVPCRKLSHGVREKMLNVKDRPTETVNHRKKVI